MEQLKYLYHVKAQVSFTAEEIDALCIAAQHHYDKDIQAAAAPGGKFQQWKDRAVLDHADAELAWRALELGYVTGNVAAKLSTSLKTLARNIAYEIERCKRRKERNG
jgi:hypothetical protein